MNSFIAREKLSSSSPNIRWIYDVFLNFRGDTRSNFTSHLDMALSQKGVNVFIDDRLDKGEEISESLSKSIEGAMILIVIFSEDYASSSWCLNELVKIMECRRCKGQKVWPIFYKVDPSDVRKQSGRFGEALAEHEARLMVKIQTWREALTAAANLSGWNLGTRKEASLIQSIVKAVLSELNCTPLYVAKYPVGIDSQLRVMMTLPSHSESEGVNMVGIYGIGGIGKTTLAKALYNRIANQFEGCSFLSNVREASQQFNGLVHLQEKLLHEILMDDLKVGNLDSGINIIRARLRSKKILIFLDDVNKREQLEALAGGRDWFGRGSKIIVTTKDNHLLSSHGFHEIHGIQALDHGKSLELFSWHAFKKNHPSSNYLELSERAVGYCKGLPLALIVLGSFLCNRHRSKWENILDEFESSLNKDIQNVLQVSFDGLEDKVKDVFLDISCFFLGENVDYVKNMLEACDLNPDFGITVLMDLSLVTIEDSKLQMHNLIRQMGQTIVHGESSEPRERSRLWVKEDIVDVLTENSGTNMVKAIKLEFPKPTELDIDTQAFRNMKNLRLLIVRNGRVSTNFEYMPNNLRWIEWSGFASSSFTPSFTLKKLVGLDLQHSSLLYFGRMLKKFERLKHVDLSHSASLEEILDFSAAQNLEKLYIRNCKKLRTIHESVVSLGKLITLDLEHCSNLEKLPSYFMLQSLEVLNLAYCRKLEEIPNLSYTPNLQKLYLRKCTSLRTIHESIGLLDMLVTLDLKQCSNLEKLPSYLMLKSLKVLNLTYCRKLEEIPNLFASSNLQKLYLAKCRNLRVLHESVGSLHKLVTLDLKHCSNLEKLPSYFMLKSLEVLNLTGCSKVEQFPEIVENMKSLRLMLLKFTAIKELPSSIRYLTGLKVLSLEGCRNLIALPSTIYLLKGLDVLHLSGCSRLDMFIHKWEPTRQPTCSSSKIMKTSSSLEFSHLLVPEQSSCSKLNFLDLQCCNISNANFLKTLSDVCPSLSYLFLSDNQFSSLPSSLHKFKSLRNLQLKNCKFLREIPNLPQNIQVLDASGCESLAKSPDNITDIISRHQVFHFDDYSRVFILMNSAIPEWFNYQTTTNSISISFRHFPNMERTLIACAVFKVNKDSYREVAFISFNMFINNELRRFCTRQFPSSTSEYMWLVTTSLTFSSLKVNEWNHITVWFEAVKTSKVIVTIRSCGFHVTEELHGIYTSDRRRQRNDDSSKASSNDFIRNVSERRRQKLHDKVVNYIDFHQLGELPRLWDREAHFVSYFVHKVFKLIRQAMSHVAKYPVRIDHNTQPMNFPLQITSDGAKMIGIYGNGGKGKTRLAKTLLNEIANKFEGCCYLAIVREASSQPGGLQERMDSMKVGDTEIGINIVRNRLCSEKCVTFLDDADRCEELVALAGGHDWFGLGSIIIVTTRNMHLLYIHGFDLWLEI